MFLRLGVYIFFSLLPILGFCSVARHVIAFWDSKVDQFLENCLVHTTLEMPLNYLGLDVEYFDIQKPLPHLENRNDVLGVIICFQEGTIAPNPKALIEWSIDAIEQGKKIVIMRNSGFFTKMGSDGDLQNRLYERLGVVHTQQWVDFPFDYQMIISDPELMPFERNLPKPFLGFYITKAYAPSAKVYLKAIHQGIDDSDLIVLSPNGAVIAENFANNYDKIAFTTNPRSLGWYLNPFVLFERVFDLPHFPIPDTTTLAGNRIFYSLCHGDNWNGYTALEKNRGKEIYCADEVLKQVIVPNPDIPVSVAVVGATVDPTWEARKRSQEIAREYFHLPQVQAASHTYSHPFEWNFFASYKPEKEIQYLKYYPYGTWQNSYLSWLNASHKSERDVVEGESLLTGFVIPRAYANEPFDLKKEIVGSVDYLNQFAPPDNQIKILLWSGNGLPWDQPLALCYQNGISNLGGGFVRFDPEYPSVLFVYPLGRKPGGYIQPYASMNAENSYTDEWKDRFYGFQYLPATIRNTESPRRLKPIALYYHSYTGEYGASLQAVKKNIAWIKKQSLIAIDVQRYCEIVKGFYSAQIEQDGSLWKISNRKGLQTFRLDKTGKKVDLSQSVGVIGYKEYQGSLYVYLDAAVEEPIIAISESVLNDLPYLIDSSWEIWDLQRNAAIVQFKTKGWGKLSMRWQTPHGIMSVERDLPNNQVHEITLNLECP